MHNQYNSLPMRRIFLLLLVLITVALPSRAVLSEDNIAGSLAVLRQQLYNRHIELERQADMMKEQQQTVTSQVISVLQRSQQNAIMLYSQQAGNIFDLTYACHEATEQYSEFQSNAAPFRRYIESANIEVSRYDSLISDLSQMRIEMLTAQSKTDRNVALTLAINIRRTLKDNRTQMEQYVRMYQFTEARLHRLDHYANNRYADIQRSIFNSPGDNYFTILRNLGHEIKQASNEVGEKYKPLGRAGSDWDVKVMMSFLLLIFFGSLLAAGINTITIGLLFTWLVRHNKLDFIFNWFMRRSEGIDPKRAFQAKRPYIIMVATVITFALLLAAVRWIWDQNFVIMATDLLVEYAWLTGVILLSLLIRLDTEQMRKGIHIYLPIMVGCVIVILFRIVLVPNSVLMIVFPPILAICALWQWVAVTRHQRHLPQSDILYTYLSLIVFLACVMASAIGYTLLSVEMLIWWTMQLACILTLTCVSSMLHNYGNNPRRHYFADDAPIRRVWFFMLLYRVVLPTMGVLSVIVSIYWAADVFNLSATTWRIFTTKLIDSKNFTLSILGVAQVIILFFLFGYINRNAIRLLRDHLQSSEEMRAEKEQRQVDSQSVVSRVAMWRNVIQVLVWGVWLLVTMNLFNINNSWLVAISAGLSTGIGFAMKDILENIYYGISLMAGRISVGDYISIDDTRGTVKSISYTSTMLESYDGSVIAFQNSQLFTKNYKNLTKNHGSEVDSITVGVAYGSNANEVKQIIAEAVSALDRPGYIRYIDTVFSNFGDSSIDFKVLAWVDSRKRTYAHGDIMTAIYNALNDHHIEIPYPQRDVRIVAPTSAANPSTPFT